MFYEPRLQEPEPFVPMIWHDWGHVPRPALSQRLSTIQSRSSGYSSSQRVSSISELPSITADASASYLELITPKTRPSSRLESLLNTVFPSMPEQQPKPKAVLSSENAQSPEHPAKPDVDDFSRKPQDQPEPDREKEHFTTDISDKVSSKNHVWKTTSNQDPAQPSSTTKSHSPQPSKTGSVTAEDLIGLELPYHLLFSADHDNTQPETRNPTRLPIPLPPPSPPPTSPQPSPQPAETPSLDDSFLFQSVPTKYLPINEQLPAKMTWLDVCFLAQSVLACPEEEDKPLKQSKVNLLTASGVGEDPAADTDGHSFMAKSHVAEVEECVEGEDDETGSVARSSFSSFDIRDVNLSLHKEVSRIWSWKEKWRSRKGC